MKQEHIMKTIGVLSIAFLAFIAAGCGTPSAKPIVSQGVWGVASEGDVFAATVKALHFEEYMVQAVDRTAGNINTDWFTFKLPKYEERILAKFKMNILVYKNDKDMTALSLRIKAAYDNLQDDKIKPEKVTPRINNAIKARVEKLFADIAKIVGQPEFTNEYTLSFE
jgi:hypothetical protein